MNKPLRDNYLTVSQTADFLGCSKESIKRLVHEGKLNPIKALPNDTRYLLSMREINKYFHSKAR